MAFWGKKVSIKVRKKEIPDGLWTKCSQCQELVYNKELEEAFMVCPKCGFHFILPARRRLDLLLDENSFTEINADIRSVDMLNFVDTKPYAKRIAESISNTGLNDAVITGTGKIYNSEVAIGVMDFSFMGGSMGSVVGEKIARLFEAAIAKRLPVVMVTASGGARMQESILSLMQMAKTSGAADRFDREGLLYISVLCNPTTGGTTASFASLGDVIIAEPDALVAFAGPRVIKQTINKELPEGFQKSEFLLEHGMIDAVVERKNLKNTVFKFLNYFHNRS